MNDQQKRWDSRYATSEYAYGEQANDFLIDHAGAIAPGKVLCLADGEGRNGVWLAGQGFEVTCVDLSPVGMDKAKKLAARKSVAISAVTADLADFEIGRSCWQGIVAIYAHVPKHVRINMHKACVAGLAPGGAFILESYGPDQPKYATGGPKDRDFLMSKDEVCKELDGLTFTLAREIVRDIKEGLYHTGEGAVTQVVAVKE